MPVGHTKPSSPSHTLTGLVRSMTYLNLRPQHPSHTTIHVSGDRVDIENPA